MQVKNGQKDLSALSILVELRAKKYDCGFRTAFIQWTSEEEKHGVTYHELRDFVTTSKVD